MGQINDTPAAPGDFPAIAQNRRELLASLILAPAAAGVLIDALGTPADATVPTTNLSKKSPLRVAVLVDEGVTLIDFAGPWEMLSSAVYSSSGFNVYSVAPSKAPIIADDSRGRLHINPRSGLAIVPDYTFADAPKPDILIVPGQDRNDDPAKHEWIRRAHRTTQLSASVCTGAFLLAKSGIMDGEAATTNASAYDAFEKMFPKIRLVRNARFVESGRVASSTGLTAGMDLALRIVDRFYGRKAAEKLAHYEEWASSAWRVT